MTFIPTTIDLDGPAFVADFGGEGLPIVLIHGLGGAHTNWLAVGPGLAEHGRVTALDLPGFGYTPAAGRAVTMAGFRRFVARYVREHLGEPAILVGNSMGGAVSLVTAAEEPSVVAGLILVDAALPHPLGAPVDFQFAGQLLASMAPIIGERIIEKRRRELGPERLTRETLALCCVDAARVPEEVVQAGIAVRRHVDAAPGSAAAFVSAARSLTATLARRSRFRGLVESIQAPGLVIQGDQDRLVTLQAAQWLAEVRPDWQFEVYDDVGHVPQLEVPHRFLATAGDWLARTRTAAGR